MDDMNLADYLAGGGKLTSPQNAPSRYRGELLRLMATFVDSELAGAAGFADCINDGPGIKARIAAARIVLEKLDHAERVLKIMGEFGADEARYVTHHPWADRLDRVVDIGHSRRGGDMRLNVFHYPIHGWTDAIVMNVLMGHATLIQLDEFAGGSYQPLSDTFRSIIPRERRHTELGEEGLSAVVAGGAAGAAQESVNYWHKRVVASFGTAGSARFELLKHFGLRHTPNEVLADRWRESVAPLLSIVGLTAP